MPRLRYIKIKTAADEFILVSPEDKYLLKHTWCVTKRESKSSTRSYAMSYINGKNVYMHRVILKNASINGKDVDHINGNGLDNRRSNLRIVNRTYNNANSRPRKGCSSSFKGVSWHKVAKKWAACVTKKGKSYHLGLYSCELEAANAYNEKALYLFGDFARLNKLYKKAEGTANETTDDSNSIQGETER